MSSITATNLYKVFGRRPERGVAALQQGSSVDDVRSMDLTPAVIDATFSIEQGEIFVVMGLSGSGKSTLIRMVNGLFAPTSGEVLVDGFDITNARGEALRRVRREKISMVFQHFALLPHRTVGENAAYALEIQGVNRAERERRAEEALGMVDLAGWGGSLPGELSGGMRQRVGLARALAAGTEILLMDEAFSALDPLIKRGMQDQLVELQNRLGKTILFITHDLNEAMRLGDRIAMMRAGRIEQIGTAEQILNDPANNYVAQFVADVDRSRVITADSVMEQSPPVIGGEQGPLAAQKVMREHHMEWLIVQGRDRTLHGLVRDRDIARAVARHQTELPLIEAAQVATASPTTRLADMFLDAAQYDGPVVVVDDEERVVGTIPQVTLLAAAGTPALKAVADRPDAVAPDQAGEVLPDPAGIERKPA